MEMVHRLDFIGTLFAALLASFHCAGMCGGFALSALFEPFPGKLQGQQVQRPRLLSLSVSQGLYHLGKTTIYLAFGALAGLGGKALLTAGESWGAARWIALAAGVILIAAGLNSLGWRFYSRRLQNPERLSGIQSGASPIQWLAAQAAACQGALKPVVLGTLSGLLPCPLVYAFLSKAAASGSVAGALATMAALGLGTIPVLTAVALTGNALSPLLRLHLVKFSGVLLILLGFYTWWRGFFPLACCVSGNHF